MKQMRFKLWLVLLLTALPLWAADVYFGNKPVVTSVHPTTNYVVVILGSGINAPVRLINASNLIHLIEAGGSFFDNIVVTNGVNHIRKQISSTNTTNQIDVAAGPQYYYWTNMVTNVVLNITNVFSLGVTNRTLDFFFTGASAAVDYTVTFACPAPAGVNFRWGLHSATNGATAFTVTNNTRLGASLTFWESNVVEGYFSPVR